MGKNSDELTKSLQKDNCQHGDQKSQWAEKLSMDITIDIQISHPKMNFLRGKLNNL